MLPSSWKTSLKRALYRLFYYSGLEFLVARWLPVDAAAVIMYHGVCDASQLPPEVDFHLPCAVFEEHLRMLKRRYPIVPLSELLDCIGRGEKLRKQVVLTFDDGYRNNATRAHPILERHAAPYCVFLATAYIEENRWMPLNELYALWHAGRITGSRMRELRQEIRGHTIDRAGDVLGNIEAELTTAERERGEESFAMLTWEQVRDLAARGVEFGSHTHTHCNLAEETPDRQRCELTTPLRLIRERTGREVTVFAYPFGRPENWTAGTRRNAIDAGYRCAILASGGLVTPGVDIHALPRVGYRKEVWMYASELALLFLRQRLR